MTKRIVRAIEALNSKKTLFLIEQAQNDDSSDDEDVDNNEEISSNLQSINMEKVKSTPVKEVSDRRLIKRGS